MTITFFINIFLMQFHNKIFIFVLMSSLISFNVNVKDLFVKKAVISSVMINIHRANIHHCTAVLTLF